MLKKLKRIAKHLLAIMWVRKTYQGFMHATAEIFSAHRALSIPYSMLNFIPFNREQYAVLRGQRNYYRNLKKLRTSHTELRRNVHRLEKGMIMRPRRPVYALDYIIETIEFYETAVQRHECNHPNIDTGELEWAHDVISQYFCMVDGSNSVVTAAKARFEATLSFYNPGQSQKVPYKRLHVSKAKVQYKDLLELSRQRRSTRWFLDQPVPRGLIDNALLVARQSPTACNRLPYEYRIFDDPALVAKVASIPFGAAGYSQQIPTVIVVVGRLGHYFSARDRHIIYVDSSLASMAFMLALETQGLASSVINWPDFEPLEHKMQKTLNLDYDERVIMLMAVGYPDPEGIIPWSQKKPVEELRRYNDLGRASTAMASNTTKPMDTGKTDTPISIAASSN